jgi:hypothetical protein
MQQDQTDQNPTPNLPTDRRALLAGIGGLAAGAFIAGKANAGPLSPPAGPIAPTPGPEPRIAINAVNTPGDANSLYKITQPGLVLPDRQHHRGGRQARRRDRGQRRDAGPQRL